MHENTLERRVKYSREKQNKKKDKLLKTNRKKLIDQGLGRSTVDVNLKKKN